MPALAERIVVARGKSYEGSQSVASRVLPLLAADGLVVRGRPRGSGPPAGNTGGPRSRTGCRPASATSRSRTAQVTLARAWLATFGPAPVADLKWWSGWTLGQTRAAVAAVGAVEVDLDGGARRRAARRPGRRPPTRRRTWRCCPRSTRPRWAGRTGAGSSASTRKALFDTNGNAGPTIWWDGRVVGGWAQRKSGEVVLRFLTDAGAEARAAAEAEAARLREWLGDVRVTPRFRTPLEKELTS